MTDRVNELAAVSLRKPVKIFVDSNKTVAWNLQQEFVRIRPSQEPHQVRECDLLVNPESTDPQ
jgi:superfamily II DNA/RNA helicase